jgi:hypothetical protein
VLSFQIVNRNQQSADGQEFKDVSHIAIGSPVSTINLMRSFRYSFLFAIRHFLKAFGCFIRFQG